MPAHGAIRAINPLRPTATKARVLAEQAKRKGGEVEGDALETKLNQAAGRRFHN